MRLFAVSLLITLCLAEGIFRVVAPQWNDQWKMWQPSALHAIGLQPSVRRAIVHGLSGEFAFQFSTNAQGLRMDYEVGPHDGLRRRILFVGDSFTFGYGVEQGETFTDELQRKGIDAINAGFASGFSTDTEYVYTREIGSRLSPDIVIVGVCIPNDLDDLATTRWTVEQGKLVAVEKLNAYVPLWIKRSAIVNAFVKGALPRLREYQHVKSAIPSPSLYSVCRLPTSLPSAEMIRGVTGERAEYISKVWAEDARQKGYEIKYLFIPERREVQGAYSPELIKRMGDIRATFRHAAEKAGITVLDPTMDMRRHWCETSEHLYFPIDGHWNAKGHRFIAQWLYCKLMGDCHTDRAI